MFKELFKNTSRGQMIYLPPAVISPNPNQLRVNFDAVELSGLAENIQKNGIIEPLAVRKLVTGGYELISGERRLRAAKMLGLKEIPCVEVNADGAKAMILTLSENFQRQDLTFFEEAEGIQRLIQYCGFTQQETAERLGCSQAVIANKLRLLRLTAGQRDSISRMRLSEKHARALLRLPDQHSRDLALNEIIAKGYNIEQTEKYVEQLLRGPEEPAPKRSPAPVIIRDVRLFVNSINRAVDTMRLSGVDAKTQKKETDNFIQYTVTIPKTGFMEIKSSIKKEIKVEANIKSIKEPPIEPPNFLFNGPKAEDSSLQMSFSTWKETL